MKTAMTEQEVKNTLIEFIGRNLEIDTNLIKAIFKF